MNLINIKKIIFAVIVCVAILMTAYTVLQIFNKPIFKIGESEINIGTIIIFFLSFYILIFSLNALS